MDLSSVGTADAPRAFETRIHLGASLPAPTLTVVPHPFGSAQGGLFAKGGQHSDRTMGLATQQCKSEIASTEQPL